MQFSLPLPRRPDLDTAFDRVRLDDTGKWDVRPARKELSLHGGQVCLPPAYEDDCPAALSLTPWATGQLCTRLGIPTPYFKRCPPCLKDSQANHWLRYAPTQASEEDEDAGPFEEPDEPHLAAGWDDTWLLRGRKDRLRGILSSRYAALDNAQLLDALRPLLLDRQERLEVKDFALSEESLHLRLVDPQLAREVLKDDRLMVGFHVSNSEVGRHSVRVDALVWRLVCSNGLIRLVNGKSLFRQRHVALDQDHFAEALRGAIAEAALEGAGLLERLAWATKEPVADVPAVIEWLGAQWRLSERTRELVKASLLSEHPSQQENLYGLLQAFTSAAHHLSPEERYRVETLAGRLAETGLLRPRTTLSMEGNATPLDGRQGMTHNGRTRIPVGR